MTDMEKRLVDKIKIGQLTQELATAKMEIELKNFIIDELLAKVEALEEDEDDEVLVDEEYVEYIEKTEAIDAIIGRLGG
jgi:hypothetical protein